MNRDLQTAAEVEHLYRLNYFSEEFLVYATAYVENGNIRYRFNEKSTPMYQFCHRSLCEGIFPLPVEQHIKIKKVETGTRETERINFCKEIAQQIQGEYPIELFRLQRDYQNIFPNDAAYKILSVWKKDLMSCFSLEMLQLFEGAVKKAAISKHLTQSSYRNFVQWVEGRKIQIDDMFVDGSNGRTKVLSGFLYKNGTEWQVFSNAVEDVVWQRQNQHQKEGIVCTPIFRKSYSLEKHPAWRNVQWQEAFDNMLGQLMDQQYLERLEQLYALPTVVDKQDYQKCLDLFLQQGKDKAVGALRYYAALCNCGL